MNEYITYTRTHTAIRTYLHTYLHTFIQTFVYIVAYIHTYTQPYRQTYMLVYEIKLANLIVTLFIFTILLNMARRGPVILRVFQALVIPHRANSTVNKVQCP